VALPQFEWPPDRLKRYSETIDTPVAKLLAIDWDPNELRLAWGASKGGSFRLDGLAAAPLAAPIGGSGGPATDVLIAALKRLIGEQHLSKSEVLWGVGRSAVEMRPLQLPLCEPDELPDMVRFTAQRTFAQLGDQWPLDFLPLPAASTAAPAGQAMMAAAVSPSELEQARQVFQAAGLELKQATPRGFAVCGLLPSGELTSDAWLLVIASPSELELVVTEAGRPVMIRTARLPSGDLHVQAKTVAAELKRTLMSATSQRPSAAVQGIVWFGSAEQLGPWQETLTTATDLPIRVVGFEPATIAIPGRDNASPTDVDPTSLSRFAPLVGLLRASGGSAPPSIDFLHPRRPQPKRIPRSRLLLAGGAIAAVVLGATGWLWKTHADLDREIADLRAQQQELTASVETAARIEQRWLATERFMAGNISWLDTLRNISEASLTPQAVRFEKANFSLAQTELRVGATGGGRGPGSVTAPIALADRELIPELSRGLRGLGYTATDDGWKPATRPSPLYSYATNLSVRVPAAEVADPRRWRADQAEGAGLDRGEAAELAGDLVPASSPGEQQIGEQQIGEQQIGEPDPGTPPLGEQPSGDFAPDDPAAAAQTQASGPDSSGPENSGPENSGLGDGGASGDGGAETTGGTAGDAAVQETLL
jgi:hypothetical protein